MGDIVRSRRSFIHRLMGLVPVILLARPKELRAAKQETKDLLRQLELEILKSSRPKRNPAIMCRTSGDETTLYRERGGKRGPICSMNPTGNMIWEACDGSRHLKEISRLILERYQVAENQARLDTLVFLVGLKEIGAITV